MRVLNVLRLVAAAATVAAIAFQYGERMDRPLFDAANFWSFFTIQSNVLGVVALGALALTPVERRTRTFDALRGAAVLYLTITGIVFAVLLSGQQETLQTTSPWVNFVLHQAMPVVLVADLLIEPPRHRLPLGIALAWLAYPLLWFGYTLVRGSIVDWYPYPFVDVDRHGYDGVALNAVVLAVAMAAGAALLAWIANRRGSGRAQPAPAAPAT
jgi:hypothetical protein